MKNSVDRDMLRAAAGLPAPFLVEVRRLRGADATRGGRVRTFAGDDMPDTYHLQFVL